MCDENVTNPIVKPGDSELRVREAALRFALQMCGNKGDPQEVVRAAREMLNFLRGV